MFVESCEAIDLLINAGANVNETDSQGRSVLFVLSSPYQKIELLNYLHSKSAKLKREEIQALLDWVISELEYRKERVHLNNNLARVEQLEKMLRWCKSYV